MQYWILVVERETVAIQNIEEVADYIAKIAQFPNLGRRRDKILAGLRSLTIDKYLILYMPIEQDVEIFRVIVTYSTSGGYEVHPQS